MRALRDTLRAVPALLRIGVLEAIAYRAEFLVWMLSTTMPLIMMALMRQVAAEAPLTGRGGAAFDGPGFTSYYLATLIVRQLTGSWVVWEMVRDIREGTLALRLLRPVSPLVGYACESLAAVPIRAFIALPIAAIALFSSAGERLAHDPAQLGLAAASLFGAWLLNFSASALIGTLALFLESSIAIWELWLGCFMLLSGYLLPLELFPRWLETAARATPFPYLQALPVEIVCGFRDHQAAWAGILRQWSFAAGILVALLLVWRAGLRRFAAYGG